MVEKRSINLCSCYVLPLLGLNQFSFGHHDKFVNSYVSEDNLHVVVECTHPYTSIITNHANFKFSFEKDGGQFAVFEVPVFYRQDVVKFKDGKYSTFSPQAKELVRKKSGLKYKSPTMSGKFETALELLALDKDIELRKYWEKLLDVKIAADAELMSVPDETNFYILNLTKELTNA